MDVQPTHSPVTHVNQGSSKLKLVVWKNVLRNIIQTMVFIHASHVMQTVKFVLVPANALLA